MPGGAGRGKETGADDTLAAQAETENSTHDPSKSSRSDSFARLESDLYTVEKLLGRGGMGEVHKAFDRVIGRHVALKILLNAGPEFAESLVHEARAQARVEHPNVCKVYGVGELNGRPFIALQLIDGATLRELAGQMTRDELIRVVVDVAEGLHAAHRLGLVHRDVKSANILVERTATGYHPYVTDFGLAKDIATGLTNTGVTKGTPAYMAPEQARGDNRNIDRRTDVYALGVVLYELLARRLPFSGDSSVAVMVKVMSEDPPSLRAIDPSIPADLEIITMKCMEKEPSRRYDSARAVAEDLQSWLDGAPIRARGASVRYRLLKRARKHRLPVSLAAMALAALSVLVGYALHARRVAAEQAQLAQAFGQQVERNDAISRYAALLPLHDSRRERRFIEANLAELERQMATLGQSAEGPGRYALGRGYLVLDRPDDARRELEKAWQLGYRAPEVSYALGLAYGELYRAALLSPDSEQDPARRARAKKELERRLRDPALAHLKASQGAHLLAPEYVEGLIAFHERRYEEALAKARAAESRVPWLFEALTLEADVHVDRAKEAWARSDAKAALAELELAGERYRSALTIAHSDSGALRGHCHYFVVLAEILAIKDQSPMTAVHDGLAACDDAIHVRPDDAGFYAEEALIWASRARYEAVHNLAARTSWLEADRLTASAASLQRDDLNVLGAGMLVHRMFANFLIDRGEDPRARLEAALAEANRVLQIDPNNLAAQTLVAGIWQSRGDWESATGVDPRPSYEASIRAARRALSLSPDDWSARLNLGMSFLSRGMWAMNHSVDVKPDLNAAAEQFEAILKLNPQEHIAAQNLCAALAGMAQAASNRDGDEAAAYERSRLPCQRAFELHPSAANAVNASLISLSTAESKLEHGGSPAALLEEARAMQRRAVAIDAANQLAYYAAGGIELLAARWEMSQQRSPMTSLAAATARFGDALRLNPRDADSMCGLIAAYRRRAEWHAAHHQPIDEDVAAGLRQSAAALALNPELGVAALHAGVLHVLLARNASGARRAEAASLAIAELERAVKADSDVAAEAAPLIAEARRYGEVGRPSAK